MQAKVHLASRGLIVELLDNPGASLIKYLFKNWTSNAIINDESLITVQVGGLVEILCGQQAAPQAYRAHSGATYSLEMQSLTLGTSELFH